MRKKKKKKNGAMICGFRTSKNRMNEKNPVLSFPTAAIVIISQPMKPEFGREIH